jgi:hypothetical protein
MIKDTVVDNMLTGAPASLVRVEAGKRECVHPRERALPWI